MPTSRAVSTRKQPRRAAADSTTDLERGAAADAAAARGADEPTAGAAGSRAADARDGGGAPRDGRVPWLVVRGARHNNLKNIDVAFPLGRFTCVTGVSGSGKSSLVNDILYEALARDLNGAQTEPGEHDALEIVAPPGAARDRSAAGAARDRAAARLGPGAKRRPAARGRAADAFAPYLDKIIAIDQSPIGRTPRSNPATYIKLFDEIRDLFTKLPDAKLRGYKPGRFSFNVAAGRKGGGRCEACEGNGANRIEMDFLADVWVKCPVCEGRRFSRETLNIQYKGRSIADVLDMDVQQALEHFENVPRIRGMLQTLHDVGLDYLKLGQSSTTLSGGEAQRIKLARELVRRPTGGTLYVLDEPTTGLHFEDIRKLLVVLHGFVDAGNTVVVIEHNLDVIKTADWIIDMGPEGGAGGGRVIAEGTPEQIAAAAHSHTGQALRDYLDGGVERPRELHRAAPAAEAPVRAALDSVIVRGAAQHNLKDVSVAFPRERMTVCTGVSGSGKTSFAIDTVFTEGYRRYVESLSAYARQFLGQLAKPKVEHIDGLSPAICIEQKSASKSPRSTVGTITEIYDYMRVLWARAGQPYCPHCDLPIGTQTADEIVERVMGLEEGSPVVLLAPVGPGGGETWQALLNRLRQSGYTRIRVDGEIQPTTHAVALDARRKHRVEVVVDRMVVRARSRSRIAESVEHALALGGGVMILLVEAVERVGEFPPADGAASQSEVRNPQSAIESTPQRELRFSQLFACTRCGASFEELGPVHFSFNHQLGWCETCEGLGVQRGAPAGTLITEPSASLFRGAIMGWPQIDRRSPFGKLLLALCARLGVSPDAPLADWTAAQRQVLLYGTSGDWLDGGAALPGVRFHWRGFFPAIDTATRNSWEFRHRLRNLISDIPCVACRGGRLRPDAAAVRFAGRTITDICALPLDDCLEFFATLRLDAASRQIAGELLKEIRDRLQFLIDVGLEYLTLHRAAPTLSGGESQRIRLASQIGSGLSGVLYVLDEPTIGLHPRDTQRLVRALQKLRDLGNTLLLVEHDREVIAAADRLIDFGPRAGAFGGRIVAEGPPGELSLPPGRARGAAPAESESLTRAYLSGAAAAAVPTNRRAVVVPPAPPGPPRERVVVPVDDEGRPIEPRARRFATAGASRPAGAHDWLVIRGARHNNLQRVDVAIPLQRLVCISGVSGSGKSSLVNDILWPALGRELNLANLTPGEHDAIEFVLFDGTRAPLADLRGGRRCPIDRVINVDQSPIGTTPSSNPATYTGAFDWIRELFARLPDSKVRGYNANRFSFNRPGGRCEACEGYGQKRIEMHFMPDVWVECETCRGQRYEPETLGVRFKGRNINDVLNLRVSEALELFANIPRVRRMLQMLADVGLDYLQLGQPAPTLSGGEAQRVKLAAELGQPDTGRTLYILDEPTTGLHFDDVRKLLAVIHRLVDLGNSVIVVEHNLDVLKSADWLIDLGPEAGAGGGRVVAAGTPEDVAGNAEFGIKNAERSRRGDSTGAQRPVPAISSFFVLNSEFPSHTARALAPLLAAGPHEARTPFDAAAHAAQQREVDRAGLGQVGKEARQPWQVDGKRWHLEQRTSRDGKPVRWEAAALEYVIKLVQQSGRFRPTNWNERASVEIAGDGCDGWFLHALTGGEWLLELYFRVPRGTFKAAALERALGLRPLDERTDLPVYGTRSRVSVRPRTGAMDAIAIYVHDRAEIDTPAFRHFVKTAARAYLATAEG